MLLKEKKTWALPYSAVTPKADYLNRRDILKAMGMAAAAGTGLAMGFRPSGARAAGKALEYRKTGYSVDEPLTDRELATQYNNFYEFTTSKEAVVAEARDFNTSPWTVKVSGLADKTGTYDLADLIDYNALEERIYRFRCVETWSMIVPWIGVPLADVVKKLGPQPGAKYVRFQTLVDEEQMPGLNRINIPWPYQEGLRMDEAMNALPLLTVGMYGEILPNQNGAPIRLIVPWKYGFKSIKSIVGLHFTDQEPKTTWNILAPNEYGFYANVNPDVSHPRWSQSSERRLGAGLFDGREDTLFMNGYADEVVSLYDGMDLKKHY
ncbi:protein-methionine-sulfoxide reductase catalytic subunit MsrP [Aestuariispira insulae]|uniref:Protein-methionine-sulfoxide reductase catalytic subunit MsrP n=1 Tax=Aestuariispira insulae TaxID=1461337 RepID=A0A3D9HJI4_9PROT|nr:protein-methionine-sulfoxide reductase catalytic subunit MsrP [Aestuariispira insulae]RED49076.1 sulfoxide reductase catalytic subunit YedY [Aestuariispira insulae]